MIHQKAWLLAAALTLSLAVNVARADAEFVPGEYVVKLKNPKTIGALDNIEIKLNAKVVRRVSEASGALLVKRPLIETLSSGLKTLKENPLVEVVEPNYIYRINRLPNDPDLTQLWGLLNVGQAIGSQKGVEGIDIDAEAAWDIQTGSKDIVVAVIDTGVDYTNQDLAPNIWVNEAEANGEAGVDDDGNGFIDDVHGYDFANNDGDPLDDQGHGSHCSGTIGARGDDGFGIVGVNWQVSIMGVKFLTASGSGTLADAVSSIDYATAMGVDIMSNSWGGGGYSEQLADAIQRASDKGILFIAAAGNDGTNNDNSAHYPSNYEMSNVLSVAAINNRGDLAYFSNYGRETVDIAAPGVDVYSTTPDGYKSWSGTSMATPHVSGVAALMLAQEPNLSPEQVIERLIATAQPLAALRNRLVSSGFVNAYHALTNTPPPRDPNDPSGWKSAPHDLSTPHPYENGTALSFEVSVPGAKKFAVYFSKFNTERNYDFVVFKNEAGDEIGRWSGNHDESFSPAVSGEKMIIELKSDKSVNQYGFDITGVAFE
ncbi:MAG: S8 family serine peptidase [Pseudobdellovibrionaceae bacterium]|nr:S8 family serine peptidase [Bdellovibrionales bacterium]USN46828.1 MAG: S8 family serine peptidase [Pseudobdellovibrionaceae bacterium]